MVGYCNLFCKQTIKNVNCYSENMIKMIYLPVLKNVFAYIFFFFFTQIVIERWCMYITNSNTFPLKTWRRYRVNYVFNMLINMNDVSSYFERLSGKICSHCTQCIRLSGLYQLYTLSRPKLGQQKFNFHWKKLYGRSKKSK